MNSVIDDAGDGTAGAPRAILFDVDGTLVDSTYAHALAWWQAFRRADVDIPMWRIHRAVGMGADQLIPHVTDYQVGGLDLDELAQSHDAIYSTFWPALRILPGARELVRGCHDAGLITVLASSASDRELGVLRKLLDLDDVLDHVTSADDVERSKPAPDVVGVAVRRAGVSPDRAVFVGDALWDARACADAGVRCIGVECGGTSAAELRAAGAIEVYRDPGDMRARWLGARILPPF